jgi:hypothetical protein
LRVQKIYSIDSTTSMLKLASRCYDGLCWSSFAFASVCDLMMVAVLVI